MTKTAEIKELGKKAIDYDRQRELCGTAAADNVLHFWMLGYQYKSLPSSPDKPLQEMLDEIPILPKEQWGIDVFNTINGSYDSYVEKLTEKRELIQKIYLSGQRNALSEEAIEYIIYLLKQDIDFWETQSGLAAAELWGSECAKKLKLTESFALELSKLK